MAACRAGGASIVVLGNAKLKPSARLAVLGLVLDRPSYGYELVARFDRAFGEQPWEWRVTPQAIYGALNDLERDGLIEPIALRGKHWAASPQRRQRQDYRVTGDGARAMRAWLAEPMPGQPPREGSCGSGGTSATRATRRCGPCCDATPKRA